LQLMNASPTHTVYKIQAITKRGKKWNDVSEVGPNRIMKECAAESKIGRKFPQRMAVRVVEIDGDGEYLREVLRIVRPCYVGQYHNGYGLWNFRAS
jgi:hypothetical protein